MVRRGSTVRVRQRALQRPRTAGLFLSDEAARLQHARAWKALWKIQLSEPFPRRPSRGALSRESIYGRRHSRKGASGAGTPWPRHRKGAPMRGKRMQAESAKRVTIDV